MNDAIHTKLWFDFKWARTMWMSFSLRPSNIRLLSSLISPISNCWLCLLALASGERLNPSMRRWIKHLSIYVYLSRKVSTGCNLQGGAGVNECVWIYFFYFWEERVLEFMEGTLTRATQSICLFVLLGSHGAALNPLGVDRWPVKGVFFFRNADWISLCGRAPSP